MPDRPLSAAAFSGSLRKGSFNSMLLRAAVELAPADLRIEILDVSAIPLYDMDVELAGFPAPVQRMRDAIRSADGVLVATPEHNYTLAGVTKTVIEWASRPPSDSSLDGKPVAVMGATTGGFGTVRAQAHFRDMAPETGYFVMQDPEMRVARAREKFDASGRLSDPATRDDLREFLVAFAAWIRRMRLPA